MLNAAMELARDNEKTDRDTLVIAPVSVYGKLLSSAMRDGDMIPMAPAKNAVQPNMKMLSEAYDFVGVCIFDFFL
jgi:hypothetical protein